MPLYTCTIAEAKLNRDVKGQLVAEIADAATRVTGIPAERVLVVIQHGPARFAIEGGRVLPEPGQEQAWLAEGA